MSTSQRTLVLLGLFAVSIAVAAGLSALSPASGSEATAIEPENQNEADPTPRPGETEEQAAERAAREHAAMLDREFPHHGLVTTAQLTVRAEPEGSAPVWGWLRLGGRVRLRADPTRTPNCSSGWYELYPRGWVCAGQGVEVGPTPPGDEETTAAVAAADVESALPYRYLIVSEPQVPEYHQLPSRDDQRAALAHGRRYAELLNADQERRAELLRAGRLPGEPQSPAVVARYLHRGFYVAATGVEVRSRRRFVRTVRGSYVKEAQLDERTGSEFSGIELSEEQSLPVAWAIRAARPLRRVVRSDGTERFEAEEEVEPYARLAAVPWLRRQRYGNHIYHVLEGSDGEERYLRAWFVAVAERHPPPEGIGENEPWVHVNLSQQTVVVYRGTEPIYATLTSTGVDEHETPVGEFSIRRKFVSDTMADIGPEAGDDQYRIEDVPWTQYFSRSVALHGAFWHSRFGMQRSHGCVNLSPGDARWIFEHIWPEVPDGWHGVTTESRSGFRGSRVVVTE